MIRIRNFIFRSSVGFAALAASASIAGAAGDVTVSVVNGQLRITGDGGDNSIVVAGTMQTNAYSVTSGDGTTTINGQVGPITSGVANREIFFAFEQGANTVVVNNANFTRTVSATFGDSDDEFTLNDVVMNKNLRLKMGNGTNIVDFFDVQISEPSKMNLGDGVDLVSLLSSEYRGGIFTADGDDTVTIVNSSHTDPKGKLSIKTGKGIDTLELTGANWEGKIAINCGAGDDSFTAGNIEVGLRVKVTGSAGTDTLIDNAGHTNGTPEFAAFEVFP
jgi:hypothetical protein